MSKYKVTFNLVQEKTGEIFENQEILVDFEYIKDIKSTPIYIIKEEQNLTINNYKINDGLRLFPNKSTEDEDFDIEKIEEYITYKVQAHWNGKELPNDKQILKAIDIKIINLN